MLKYGVGGPMEWCGFWSGFLECFSHVRSPLRPEDDNSCDSVQ